MNFEKLAHGSPQWTQGAQTHTSSATVSWDRPPFISSKLTKIHCRLQMSVVTAWSWKAHFITVEGIFYFRSPILRWKHFLFNSVNIFDKFFFLHNSKANHCLWNKKKFFLNKLLKSVNKHNYISFFTYIQRTLIQTIKNISCKMFNDTDTRVEPHVKGWAKYFAL